MGLFLPNHIFPEAPTLFDWNYAAYLGDGIPLLFWFFVNPYPPCGGANDYKWQIWTSDGKSTPYNVTYNNNGLANTMLKFPSSSSYGSNMLRSVFNGSTLGPYAGNCALILIDSPWARSCWQRIMQPDADKNKNYAVGVSLDMAVRISQSYGTWASWWNANNLSTCTPGGTNTPKSLLPTYLKNTLIAAGCPTNGGIGTNGMGVNFLDICFWTPTQNGYGLGFDQAGIIFPEIGGVDINVKAEQCTIVNNGLPLHSDTVNPFAKTFWGCGIAIYKDYDVQDYIINNSLLINVPWSGMLTGAGRDIDYPDYGPIPENNIYKMNVPKPNGCSLTCPQDLPIDNYEYTYVFDPLNELYSTCNYDDAIFAEGQYFNPSSPFTAPYTWPRFARRSQNDYRMNTIYNSSNLFTVNPVNPCTYLPYILNNSSNPILYYLNILENPLDIIGPWWHSWKITATTRQHVAGGGCSNSIMDLFV